MSDSRTPADPTKNSRLSVSTLVFSFLTMVSRVSGYLRDATIFIVFGAGGATDAFLVAFRIPNFLRRLFAEGAFTQAFLPVVAGVKANQGEAHARAVIARVAGGLSVIVSVVTVIGILTAPWLIIVFAPGFINDARFDLVGNMLRITFPYILFISLTALCAGVLNTYGRFAIPAFTPVLLNLVLIAAALWLAPHLDDPITALAWGVLIAGVAQLSVQVLALKKSGLLLMPRVDFSHPAVRRVMRLMVPAALATSVVQVNLLADTLIASLLAEGSISWLYLSDRFVELPVGVFAVALSTVLLPRLAKHSALGAGGQFNQTVSWGGSVVVVMAAPCMIGLIVLGEFIFISLVQYREFTATDVGMATASLMAYAIGLPAFMLAKVMSTALFARQDTRTPVRIAVVAMGVNIMLNISLVFVWRYAGWAAEHAALALATSVSSWLQCALLFRAVRRADYRVPPRLYRLVVQCVFAGLGMGVCLVALVPAADVWYGLDAGGRLLGLSGVVAGGAAAYVALLYTAGVRPRHLAAV